MIGKSSPFNLDGKCAVVTGGTKGLGCVPARCPLRTTAPNEACHRRSDGHLSLSKKMTPALTFPSIHPSHRFTHSRAIVEALASHGAKVHTCARTKADVDASIAQWRRAGLTITGSVCDVSSPDSRASLVAKAAALYDGKVDILVSNVGFNIRKPTVEFTPEEYRRLMDTNLEASFALCQVFHPLLKRSGNACVLFNSSVASLVSMQSGAVYAMTKSAMNMLTKYLACEWAKDGVRVNAVAPWYINTPLAKQVLAVSYFSTSYGQLV
jgi:Tropinone reductase 1